MPNSGASVLPTIYASWVDQLLGGAIPEETRATCEDCAMCAKPGDAPGTGSPIYFNPKIKCCTFLPALPNFLVGRILLEDVSRQPDLAHGQASVRERLRARVAVTPLGIAHAPVYDLLYRSNPDTFGRSSTLLCPHYVKESGRCGIWRHREATCATWFCKHVRGATGKAFWEMLHQLLSVVEKELSQWCVLELGVDSQVLQTLFPTSVSQPAGSAGNGSSGTALEGVVDAEAYRAAWGHWEGREEEFYRACARLVDQLSWADVTAICGPEVRLLGQLAGESYKTLISDEVPDTLRMGSYNVISSSPHSTRVWTYSGFDPLDVPNPLVNLLHYFDGRPTDEALWAIADEEGIMLDESLVRKLADFKILLPQAPGETPPQ